MRQGPFGLLCTSAIHNKLIHKSNYGLFQWQWQWFPVLRNAQINMHSTFSPHCLIHTVADHNDESSSQSQRIWKATSSNSLLYWNLWLTKFSANIYSGNFCVWFGTKRVQMTGIPPLFFKFKPPQEKRSNLQQLVRHIVDVVVILRKCQTFLCCCFHFLHVSWFHLSVNMIVGYEEKGVFWGTQKASEIIRAFAEVSGIVCPWGKVLIVTAPGFTFLNPGVTALSEDSTEATSPAEISKSWHSERWRHIRGEEERPAHIQW